MKKIATVLIAIAAFAALAFVCWRYFTDNFMEYHLVAELELGLRDELYFTENTLVRVSEDSIKAYKVNDDGELDEVYSENRDLPSVVFNSDKYVITSNDGINHVYAETDKDFISGGMLEGELISAHQLGEKLYIKVKPYDQTKTVFYTYDEMDGFEKVILFANGDNDTEIKFADYCRDDETGYEYYMSYEACGEFVKLVIRVYNKLGLLHKFEIENMMYNDFDYIDQMLIFYTDHSIMFYNTDTTARREQYCFDVNALEKFVYGDKIVYYWEDAYFDGVNNLMSADSEKSLYFSFADKDNVCKFGSGLIYSDTKYVKSYNFGGSLLGEDTTLITEDGIVDIGVMGDMIAVVKKDSVLLMKGEER